TWVAGGGFEGAADFRQFYLLEAMDETTWLNDTDPRPEKRIGVFDHTHRGVITVTYALPVGKGRAVGIESRWLNQLVGGWQLNAIYTKQSGQPFTWMGTSSTTIG